MKNHRINGEDRKPEGKIIHKMSRKVHNSLQIKIASKKVEKT